MDTIDIEGYRVGIRPNTTPGITKKCKTRFSKNLGLGIGKSWKLKPGIWVIVILLCLT